MDENKRNELVNGWQRAVKASIAWAQTIIINILIINDFRTEHEPFIFYKPA